MNHDATHCLDYTSKCPKDCYRAQLTEELKHRKDLYYLPMSWSHFGETEECLKKKEVWKMSTIDFEVHLDMDEIIERLKEQGWRPMKHGHFTAYWHGSDLPVTYSCSVCGFHNSADTQYCPHCGAYMVDEVEE